MPIESIFSKGDPLFYCSARDDKQFAALFLELLRARPSGVVRVLRGTKSVTRAGFFDEAIAALQFPYYFGGNWHAFSDCLSSLWTPGDAIVLLIRDAQRFLSEEPARTLGNFISVIQDANAAYVPPDGSPTFYPLPTKVIFQVSEADQPAFAVRVAEAAPGVALEPVA